MEHANKRRKVVIRNEYGEYLAVELTPEGDRVLGEVWIDDVPYHVELVPAGWLTGKYCVDHDSDYAPRCDGQGNCVMFCPYSE